MWSLGWPTLLGDNKETAGSIEMPFGLWGAVGPSNHVLDGGQDPPMVRGKFWVVSSPTEKRKNGMLRNVHDMCRRLAKDDAAFYRITSISCIISVMMMTLH